MAENHTARRLRAMSRGRVSRERLLDLLDYDPETGIFTWRPRDISNFADAIHSAAHQCARWNTRYAGKRAGTVSRLGYRSIIIDYVHYFAHRLAWYIENNEWPEVVDHINGDPDDNRISNLRSVNDRENHHNQGIRTNNTSGIVGVSWDPRLKRWHARIMVDGVTIQLGFFQDIELAKAARLSAESKYDFHPNHGKRPCVNAAKNS